MPPTRLDLYYDSVLFYVVLVLHIIAYIIHFTLYFALLYYYQIFEIVP